MLNKIIIAVCIIYLFAVIALFTSEANAYDAHVVNVHDGDSLEVKTVRGTIKKIRINGIDAPELKAFNWGNQPHGRDAYIALHTLCYDTKSTIKTIGKDRYGRSVADVKCSGKRVSVYMLDNGHAWAEKHAITLKVNQAKQAVAQANKLGLWADSNPIEPSVWRSKGMKQ